ncbi:hypothetical protein CHLRE_38g759997v5 [Chlamydomonas reinhardtii]|uniref:Uncharacterized protein n=1 Tax=Chlamydomonas reinhardtii TaxID=3055 RepID=A0A2K3CMV0_CHLRE|nr:uncharacterized protein CHLRE_38g759997v5 [Chlamydomonas reinhardtii]PNW69605.1 hypothetical protein CHLRE_38g759997v5 [Chlamydomonas reinhardtii]
MDATSKADLPDYAADNRLPPWLLPDQEGKPAGRHLHYRPDILLIPSISLAAALNPDFVVLPSERDTIHIIEAGYTADTNHAAKQHEKAQQQQALAADLREAGWKVQYTPQSAISLGFAGTIRKDLHPLLTSLPTKPGSAATPYTTTQSPPSTTLS